jgi:hypothetical protein
MITHPMNTPCARLRLLLLCLALLAHNGSADASAPFELHVVASNETAVSLAEKYLGHPDAAAELLQFNAIANPNDVTPGRILAIPLRVRTDALRELAAADEGLHQARAADAERFASNLFAKASSLHASAHKNRQRAAYDQASAQAAIAEKLAGLAAEEADRTAPVSDEASIQQLSGRVEWSKPGEPTWSPAEVGVVLTVGARVKTGPAGRADIKLADGSTLQLQSDSEFQLAELTRDRRNQKRTSRLNVQVGEMVGRITPRENTNSQFHILSNGSVTAIRGTELRVGSDPSRAVRVAVLEGEVALNSAGEKITLPKNFGSVVPFNQPPSPPIKLPPPPTPDGPTATATTAQQRVLFAWTPANPIAELSGYRIEIASDTSFTRIVQDERVKNARWTSATLAPGDYQWRISSINPDGLQGPSTEARALTILRNLALTLIPSRAPVTQAGAQVVSPLYAFAAQPNSDTSVVDVEYSVDGGPFQVATEPIQFSEAGPRTLKARAIGADGKTGEPVELKVTVDAAAPDVAVAVSPNYPHATLVKAFKVTLTASDETGVEQLDYALNEGEFTAYQGPIELGAHTSYQLRFRASDVVGNVSEARTMNFPALPAPRGALPVLPSR